MKRYMIIALAPLFPVFCGAQVSIDEVLRQVEANNATLKAASEEMRAETLENRGEAILGNPEFDMDYLWESGNPGSTSKEFRVTQSFDLATVSGMRSSLAKGKNELSGLSYKAARQEILLTAKLACLDLVYGNAMRNETRERLERARSLVSSLERQVEVGGASVLELNKAKTHMMNIRANLARIDMERQSLLGELRTLNGGEDVDFDVSSYELLSFPADFETCLAEASEKDPSLAYARMAVDVDKKNLSIDKAAWVPEITLGYMSEIHDDTFRGLTLGLSIPLWSNSNKVKQSRARVAAAQARETAAAKSYYGEFSRLYQVAAGLKASSESLRVSLVETDNRDLLYTALSKGEISMVDYLVETDLYYDALEQTLATERDYHKAMAELKAWEL